MTTPKREEFDCIVKPCAKCHRNSAMRSSETICGTCKSVPPILKREGLRPCPWCGSPSNVGPFNYIRGEKRFKAECGSPKCLFVADDRNYARSEGSAIEAWNNAFCWKEIDRLKLENADLDDRRKTFAELFGNERKEVVRLRAALEKITSYGCKVIQYAPGPCECVVCIATEALRGGKGSGEGEGK